MSVIVNEDNTAEWAAAFKAAKRRALEAVGLTAERYAKASCPVDTGNLRNSITHQQIDADTEAIGTNVEYGKYVELGTRRMRKKPYLVPAASGHREEYALIFKEFLSR